ncbi:MAG: hypothetical protein AAGN46_17150 [Acidobacteriota bacterium]
MKEAYQRLESLDERLTYKIRPKQGYIQPSTEQVNAHLADLANYTIELKDIVRDLMLAFAKPKKAPPTA